MTDRAPEGRDAATPAAVDPRDALRQAMPGIPPRDLERFAAGVTAVEPYAPGPDSRPREFVPQGTLTQHRLAASGVYPGVAHDFRVHVSAQCRRDEPASVMVFLDGARYLGSEASAAVVIDNLVAEGSIPPLVAVFVQPGEPGPGLPIYGGTGNRSIEYDAIDDAYARFLLEDLLPVVAGLHPITQDPSRRAICGLSSGGNCAFAVAWHRPDAFRKVVSHCGSFVDIRGGDAWPAIVRREPARPLRVFLQTGVHDLDVVFGDWVLANRALASALAYRDYDHRFIVGEGGHSLAHGGAILPETLRWLWR